MDTTDSNEPPDRRCGPDDRGRHVDVSGELPGPEATWLTRHLVAAMAHLDAVGHVRVRVVGDQAMRALHDRWKGDPTTTDVLTFDLADHHGGPLDADIVVCLDEATRQADRRGHTPQRELLLYALHGVLHCLGHDDHDDDGFRAMHRLEDEVLVAIGAGATFTAGEAGA